MAKRRNKPRYVDIVRKGGVEYLYFRKDKGRRIPLRGPLDSAAFWKDYSEAAGGAVAEKTTVTPGSIRSLVDQYYRWPAFRELRDSTKAVRRRILERFCKECGSFPYATIPVGAVRKIQDDRQDTPAAANNLIKALRAVYSAAMERGMVSANPFAVVRKLKEKKEGATPWTAEDIAKYQSHHPVGTVAHLTLSLFMFTGQRLSDVAILGRRHEWNNWLQFKQQKTGTPVEIPIVRPLRQALDRTETGDLTYIVTEHGRPFSVKGLGNKFRDWCDEAGLPDRSAHGLRKSLAELLAEMQFTAHEICAILGWLTLAEAQHYTEKANRRKMAGKLVRLFEENDE